MINRLTSSSGSRVMGSLVFAAIALMAASPGTSAAENPADPHFIWGPTTNGLRCRIVPVSTEMSEDAIHLDKPQSKFQNRNDVAFAVEVENVSDKPVKLLDTRYGTHFGKSSGKPNSDWFSQFLFDVEYFDRDGKKIPKPVVNMVDAHMTVDGMAVATVEPGTTHRFLLRPPKWRSALSQRLAPGKYRARIRYRGLPRQTADRIRGYSSDSEVLAAWSGDLASPPAEFEITADPDTNPQPLAWGEPSDGMRAALELVPNRPAYAHGEKPDAKFHLQNVSDKPITFSAPLWLSELNMSVVDAQDQPVDISTTWYSGFGLVCRVTLQPQQTVIFDAGNLGIAANKQQADAFEHVTNRKLIAQPGRYTLRFTDKIFGRDVTLKDGKGNQLAPLEGDWTGSLETGPLKILVAKAIVADSQSDDEADSRP